MITIDIPNFGEIELAHLVCDYNGTLAFDGFVLPQVKPLLLKLSEQLQVHVITADTFGFAQKELEGLPISFHLIQDDYQHMQKEQFILGLGATCVCAIGNGRNDQLMLKSAVLGMAVLQKEGGFPQTLMNADIIFPSIIDALESLVMPKRLIATLRG